MLLLARKIALLDIGWNERPLGLIDAERLCKRLSVTLDERPLAVDGFYYRVFDRDFIAINSRLAMKKKLLVIFHELGHCIFHAPASATAAVEFHHVGKRTRQELEADMFALCALIPRPAMIESSAEDLVGEGFSAEMVADRLALFTRYGI